MNLHVYKSNMHFDMGWEVNSKHTGYIWYLRDRVYGTKQKEAIKSSTGLNIAL